MSKLENKPLTKSLGLIFQEKWSKPTRKRYAKIMKNNPIFKKWFLSILFSFSQQNKSVFMKMEPTNLLGVVFLNLFFSLILYLYIDTSDAEAEVETEAEAPEEVGFWWKRKRLKICRFRFHSVSKLLFEFW
jgi:hypothetical protein